MTLSDFASRLGDTLKGIIKIATGSRIIRNTPQASGRIIILGNGPSLRTTIAENSELLKSEDTMAVNFMANTPEFVLLQPRYYILADPHFFTGLEHENVKALWKNISDATWPMTLFVPARRLKQARELTSAANAGLTLATFNFVGIEGFDFFERVVFSAGLAMPRPRNVLIPAIMCAIRMGFTKIDIVGADHSWLETIRVTDENHVVSVQPHFYADSSKELKRSETEYRGYHLHDILRSFYIAFSSYHRLQRYAFSRGITVTNATPGSYIDAFPRIPLK
ncbi:MAG: hypothetical protein K2M19_04525 [Muribaculaceae bacterium]|nr:hypothetical protein [Muribaculaceae bacterium]